MPDDTPHPAHEVLAGHLLPLWYAHIAWANQLLVHAFKLEHAQDILRRENRGTRQVPGTAWFIKTHGVGVDIFKTPDVGGIDFDFDKPDPDPWRLLAFLHKQVNDGQLSYALYQPLVEDEELAIEAIKAVLAR
ncbi:DUF6896 domain-containing protein [Variovorax sp. PAMC26660]|uniref:DUF6896 domain-containing protein n=1 Tax=Variovorax sp. PAMC26660 TaxID=2762322 RepID=UPI00164D2447|nr:hypothetical protein [Variovorax sp. PAMC26660]QNK70797.1 hypothetical protein H7F35_14425 [Variovorax sp. PAMC26660]